jgi:uracil-DNA glycosylase
VRSLEGLRRAVVACRACPRLVDHRERVARERVRRFAEQRYWGRPVPGFGDPGARVLVVGLAPAAHGANRTGRMFTGDESGRSLFGALHRAGFANQAESVDRSDGLELQDVWITAVARCAPPANKPTRDEIERCRPFLLAEIALLRKLRVVVALGTIAHAGFLDAVAARGDVLPRPRPRFAHGAAHPLASGLVLLDSYHPSQQNTFTGRLTRPMLHAVFRRARVLANAAAFP